MRPVVMVAVLLVGGVLSSPCRAEEAARAVAVVSPKARAVLTGTSEESAIGGVIRFTQVAIPDADGHAIESVVVSGTITGAPPGRHGFHIHEFGSCDDAGSAAGGHYNPRGMKHGHLLTDGLEGAHAGDLGNVEIDPDGTGSIELIVSHVTLHGDSAPAIAGRAVILHELPDDFGQPTGNAGSRIACGPILITK